MTVSKNLCDFARSSIIFSTILFGDFGSTFENLIFISNNGILIVGARRFFRLITQGINQEDSTKNDKNTGNGNNSNNFWIEFKRLFLWILCLGSFFIFFFKFKIPFSLIYVNYMYFKSLHFLFNLKENTIFLSNI